MYTMVLIFHSWLRWAALIAGIGATATALGTRASSVQSIDQWGAADRWGLTFTSILDIQLLIGLLLYAVLSPFASEAFRNFGATMRNPLLRFWAVEHVTLMVAAVLLAHVGRVLARNARTPASKRIRLLVCFGLSVLAMIAGIPWPGMSNGRPLFRV